MRRARAFTLIELLVVIAVVAILLALVGPSMADLLATQRVRNINAQLVTDFQFARSEAVRRKANVMVWFQGSDSMTCYVMTLVSNLGTCDCTATPGSVCSIREEIKTVQVPASMSIRVAPVVGQTDTSVPFSADDGRISGTTPSVFRIDVVSTRRGKLRTTVGLAGRPTVCSPDGSITGVPACP